MLPILQQGSRKIHSETSEEKTGVGEAIVLVVIVIFVSGYWIGSVKGQERGAQESMAQKLMAQKMMAQVPETAMYIEREELRKEEQRLSQSTPARQRCMQCNGCFLVDNDWDKRVELRENIQALDTREWEQVTRRAMALGGTVEREPSIKEEMPQKIPICSQINSFACMFVSPPIEASHDIMTSEKPFKCPNCCGFEPKPLIEEAEMQPILKPAESSMNAAETPPVSNIVIECADGSLEENETPTSIPSSSRLGPKAKSSTPFTTDSATRPEDRMPEQNTLNIHPEPAARATGPPETTTAPTPASETRLEDLAAEIHASNEETRMIGLAREALKSRERALQAQGKERKRRIQEVNRPRSENIWPVVKGMLVGSALAVVAVVAVGRS